MVVVVDNLMMGEQQPSLGLVTGPEGLGELKKSVFRNWRPSKVGGSLESKRKAGEGI